MHRMPPSTLWLLVPGRRSVTNFSVKFIKEQCLLLPLLPNGTVLTLSSRNMTSFHRLPSNVKPSHYKIHLQPNFVDFTCKGKEEVSVEVFEPTSSIILNSAEIIIKSALYVCNNGKNLQSKSIETNEKNETATITFSETLPVEKSAVLHLEFQAEINDKLKGIYRSKYFGSDGSTKYAVVTQFAATDARRCFPCWDEPALKSTFDILLTVPKNLVSLSNMPVKTQTLLSSDSHLQTVAFETSPIMSTYLVAIVIGEFDFVEDHTSDDVLVRVYTPKAKQEQGKFALEVAKNVLPYYKSYFDIPYPLPKIDLIAIADISVGAMENWGLITYRETRLLVDPENTSESIKQKVALVVGHELAHQWFGNLVTMEWWTHVWLNEGYASFVEFLSVNLLFPEYDIWTQFVTDTYIKALELDALKNSHPIEVQVNDPSEINEIFDDISYNKGASIIRMLYTYLGNDNFRKGMSLYLKKYKYSNAQTEDLWRALEKASNKPVMRVMSTWTKQKGFPFLKVSEVTSSDPNKRTLSFTQQKFLADGSTDQENNLWVIPITVSSSANPEKIIKEDFMDTKTKIIEFEGISKNSWIKVNSGTVGVYRTIYSNDLLEAFVPAIQNRSLPPLDRLGLLDDLSALSQAGHISAGQVLKLIQAFKNENNYTVWCSIMNCLDKIELIISHLEIKQKFKKFGCLLAKDIYAHLGWDKNSSDGHLTTLFRSLIVSKMISFEDKSALEEAKRRFQDHVFGKVILSADLRGPVYRAALSNGNASTFDTLLTIYRSTDLNEEKTRILGSLGATKDENLLRRALEFSLSSEVKSQDTIFVIASVTTSYKGRIMAWQFFKDNYDALMERCKSGFLLTKLVKSLTQHFVTEEYAQEIKSFFDKHPTPGAERNVQQSIETIKLNAAWLQRDKDTIEQFLNTV